MTEVGMSEDDRKALRDAWIGPPVMTRDVPPEESWAPSWWHGDDDAAASAMAAVETMRASRSNGR